MPATSATDIPFAGCPDCGAQRRVGARFCWLCGAPHQAADQVVVAEAVETPTPAGDPASLWQRMNRLENERPWLVHGAIWGLLLVEGIIAYGLLNAQQPALAWLFAFAVAPAFVLTLTLAIVGRLRGHPWGPLKKVATFFGTIAVTIGLGIVGIVLLVVAG
ncbi:MAG: zinc ribbon domain-containing protein, partial [Pirellulaceae bacterium]|nr:zinc ribbon domain-containing protein [Pirellulaceae bacterium]